MGNTFRETELQGWTTRAASYDQHLTPVTNQVIAPIIARLGPSKGTSALDVCCGPGHLSAAIARQGADVVGVDFSLAMIEEARGLYPGIGFIVGDAEALPFPEAAFDIVACAFGIMHLTNPDAAVAEAFRVLRPEGRYAFTQWAQDDEVLNIVLSAINKHGNPVDDLPPAPPPFRFSDPGECRRVLEAAGFQDVHCTRIDTEWIGNRPEELLDFIYGAAVRVAMVLDAQQLSRRVLIHDAIVAEAAARTSDGRVVIKRPAVMASGKKISA